MGYSVGENKEKNFGSVCFVFFCLFFNFLLFLIILHWYFSRSEEELRRINNVRTQRLQKMEQRRENDTVEVMTWLQNNHNLFQRRIFEPVCMSLNVRDPRYTMQAEAFFGGRDFYSFVAQCDEDRELFLREVSSWCVFVCAVFWE